MTSLATIKIEELTCDVIVGIHDYERKNAQKIALNIALVYEYQKASLSDNINDALDYHVISKEILRRCKKSNYYLIETLAKELFDYLTSLKNVLKVTLEICKPEAVKEAKTVSITVSTDN